MEETDAALREVAKKRVEARMGLITHLAMYAFVNAGLVVIWWATHAGYPWFIWPMLGWGVGIVGHIIAYSFGPGSRVEERAIAQELRRLHGRTH